MQNEDIDELKKLADGESTKLQKITQALGKFSESRIIDCCMTKEAEEYALKDLKAIVDTVEVSSNIVVLPKDKMNNQMNYLI